LPIPAGAKSGPPGAGAPHKRPPPAHLPHPERSSQRPVSPIRDIESVATTLYITPPGRFRLSDAAQSAGTQRKICTTRFFVRRIEARRIAARVVSAWLGPARRGLNRIGEAQGGSARGDAARQGKVLTIILLNLSCQPLTNFGRVKSEIHGLTESGISPPRRAEDAAFRLSSIQRSGATACP
jgi:hypothetical protein